MGYIHHLEAYWPIKRKRHKREGDCLAWIYPSFHEWELHLNFVSGIAIEKSLHRHFNWVTCNCYLYSSHSISLEFSLCLIPTSGFGAIQASSYSIKPLRTTPLTSHDLCRLSRCLAAYLALCCFTPSCYAFQWHMRRLYSIMAHSLKLRHIRSQTN